MAYDYMDPMGNYTGYEETDEERRRRLAEEAAKNATPVTQTIKTNPVTGEQEMTIKGTPADLSAANPRTPTVTAPVSPDQIFQRQIMAESAGQQYNPQGGILTSPKGAQGIAQIMPATAAQPGYGIKPATPEEIATREGNMAFGERYKQGMLQAFGGDQQKATAAYNAGPGAIRRAEQQAAASGGAWTDYIPKETMAYLGKVFGNMMPTAQAGEVSEQQRAQAPTITVAPSGSVTSSATTPAMTPIAPTPQAAPQVAPAGPVNPMYAFNATGGAPGLRMPDAMQQQQAMEQARRNQAVNEFQTATTNPDAMIEYMARKDVPDDLKTAMKINHFESLSADKRRADVEQKLTKTITENPQQIPRILNDKTEEGSIAKAFLYSLIGFKSGAEAEVAKMNLPGKWTPAEDANGRTGMVLYSTSGKPLQGVNSDNTKMSPEQLSAFASAGTTKRTKPDVSMQDVEKGNLKGRVVTTYDRQNRPTTVVESGGKTFAYDASWKPVSIGTAAEKAETAAGIKLRYAGPTAYTEAGAKFAGAFNTENGTNIGYQMQQPGAPLVDLNTGKPVQIGPGGVISVTQSGTPGAAPAPAAPAPAAPAAESKLPTAPKYKEAGYETETPSAFAARSDAWKKTYAKQYEQQVKNTKEAKQLLPFINEMKGLIDKSTSSGIGTIVDSAGNFFGYSTSGAEAIAAIAPLANKVLMGVQRFEGPQSDRDVASYKEASGKLADPTVPAAQKQAAFNTIIEIMKRNAPELNWASVEGPQNEVRNKADDIIKRKKP